MTTLKEEIYKILRNDDVYLDDETIDIEYCVNEILKLIEKRIDATIQDIKRDVEYISKYNLNYNETLPVQLHHVYRLKKEMLK